MKGIWIIGGAIIGLIAIVLIVGTLLPRDHVAASTIVLRQLHDSVWRTVRDVGGTPAWWPELVTSERSTDSAGREVWDQKTKGGFTMRLIVVEDAPPARLVMEIDVAPNAAFGGTWEYDVTPSDGGTRVTVTERGYINNPMYRFMSRFIIGYHATQEGYLRALARKFGEDVKPQETRF